jgi:hypothetical protein
MGHRTRMWVGSSGWSGDVAFAFSVRWVHGETIHLAFRRIDSKKRAFESNRNVPCILLLQSEMDIGTMPAGLRKLVGGGILLCEILLAIPHRISLQPRSDSFTLDNGRGKFALVSWYTDSWCAIPS